VISTRFLLLLLAGFGGSVLNALGGGGAFIVFPALLLAGVPATVANATSSLVLLPGGIAIAWVYRGTLTRHRPGLVTKLLIFSTAGAIGGSMLMLRYPTAFSDLVPWLLLLATVLFTFAPRLRSAAAQSAGHQSIPALLIGQFAIGLYGGYFGAGMGVLALALYVATAGMKIQDATGLRTVCNTLINVLAVIVFASKGAVAWQIAFPMVISGSVAGYFVARIVHALSETAVRRAILIYAWILTAWFLLRPLLTI
jgi:uncharacterized membrane protein YfcA